MRRQCEFLIISSFSSRLLKIAVVYKIDVMKSSNPSSESSTDAAIVESSRYPTVSIPAACTALLIGVYASGAFVAQAVITHERFVSRGLGTLDVFEAMSSYLTNLTVLLTAIAFLCVASPIRSPAVSFFRRPSVTTAVVLYMVFVGLGYNVLLRGLWTPMGFRSLLNESLHTVLPVATALYWMFFVPRFHLSWRKCFSWLIYPLGYLSITLWRGSRSNFYPYPFLDVDDLGYERVLFNASMLTLAFLVLMAIFLLINRRR